MWKGCLKDRSTSSGGRPALRSQLGWRIIELAAGLLTGATW